MRIFFLGYPGGMGGANTECFHLAKLWRMHGIDVTFIPTWGCDDKTRASLDAIGCKTVISSPEHLHEVDGLASSIVVGMCNMNFCERLTELKSLGCRSVWLNCMTFMFPAEERAFLKHGRPDVFVFQSQFQREQIEPQLFKFRYTPGGDDKYTESFGRIIRGPMTFDELPFSPRPHENGFDFIIGRLSRPDIDKWSSNHWPILAGVPYAGRRSLNMGWNEQLHRKLGKPPKWAECLAPLKISVKEFLGRCHAMLGLNGGARENWPRIGLESMAAGVPLVCQNLWGWREMIEHGKTGFLFDNDQECQYYLARLAHDEELRMEIIHNARAAVERMADPQTLGQQWLDLFQSLHPSMAEAA